MVGGKVWVAPWRHETERTYSHSYPSWALGSGSDLVVGMMIFQACMPPGCRVSGTTVRPFARRGFRRTRGSPAAGGVGTHFGPVGVPGCVRSAGSWRPAAIVEPSFEVTGWSAFHDGHREAFGRRRTASERVGAPEVGDPRVRLKPRRANGRTVVPLTRQPGGMQAWKIIIPTTKSEPDPKAHEGYEWLYVLSVSCRQRRDPDLPTHHPDRAASPTRRNRQT